MGTLSMATAYKMHPAELDGDFAYANSLHLGELGGDVVYGNSLQYAPRGTR